MPTSYVGLMKQNVDQKFIYTCNKRMF